MAFTRDSAPEIFRNARQLNISIMIILGSLLCAHSGNNSNIYLNMLKIVSGALLGWALGKSPEFFSRLRRESINEHDVLRVACVMSSFLLALCSYAKNNRNRFVALIPKDRNLKITNTTRLGVFLTLFSLIGPEILDTFAAFVASNKLTKGLARHLAAGYTPPSGSTMLSSHTIRKFTPTPH